MTIILETHNLRKEFGGLIAVDDVSLQVRQGTLHSIIGPNGAGKTTLFNLLSRYLKPTAGRVIFKGRDITRLPPQRVVRLGLGRSFQITNLFSNLTVLENVRLATQAMGGDNFKIWGHFRRYRQYEERALAVIAQIGLADKILMPARTLPHGDQRKLEIGLVLASDPEVLLMDEPTAGMSSEEVPALLKIIQSIVDSGRKTIVLVEHKMDMVMSVSDVITVMHQGRVLAEGPPREIAANETVQSAYLGELYGKLAQDVGGAQ